MSTSTLFVRVANTERDERREHIFARSPVRVGRSQQNELALEHAFVSHCHGLFLFDSDGVSFVDVGSTNGSFLNGTRLNKDQRVALSGSAVLTIGALRLEARLSSLARLSARFDEPQAAPVPADVQQRSALLSQRFAQSFIDLRRGQHQLLRELGLPVPSTDKLQTIDSARELLLYLLDPAAGDDRVDELSSAYADLMRHEVALLSAVSAGCQELLDELSPTHLAPHGLGGVAGWVARLFGHDARWRRLEDKTEELREQTVLSSVVLGRSFARAYVAARSKSFQTMRHSASIILCLASLALSACVGSARDRDPPAVCTLPLPKHLQHTSPDKLPASVWYQLLFKGYRDGISADLVDCSGEPIVWAPLPSSCLEREPPSSERQRRRQLGADGLIVRHAGGDYWFGWAPFVAFDNGMSEGPLAIARVHHGKLEVRAIGNLRAYTKRVGLEIRKLAGQHILVAEGEWCGARQTCVRGTRLLWLDRQRFRERPLRSATLRSCLGPAWFAHSDVIETKLSKRWSRKLQRDVALAYQDDLILVAEHITVNDHDLSRPSLPPRLFREAQAQIRVTLEGGELLSEGQSLWGAIRVEDGSTELRDRPPGAR